MGRVWKRPESAEHQPQNGASHVLEHPAASASKPATHTCQYQVRSTHARHAPMQPHALPKETQPGASKQAHLTQQQTPNTGTSSAHQPPCKRQRVEGAPTMQHAAHAVPTTFRPPTSGAAPQGASTSGRQPAAITTQQSVEAAPTLQKQLKSREAEMEELRRQLQEKEEQVRKQKALLAAQEAARSAQRQQQADLLKKKEQLSKGFQLNSGAAAEAVAAAAKVLSQGAGTAAPGIATAPADELEVARVLHSRSDYECLKLHPGASMAAVRKSYRALAVALHPDKCKLEGAADAFQRINKAYNSLAKHAA